MVLMMLSFKFRKFAAPESAPRQMSQSGRRLGETREILPVRRAGRDSASETTRCKSGPGFPRARGRKYEAETNDERLPKPTYLSHAPEARPQMEAHGG